MQNESTNKAKGYTTTDPLQSPPRFTIHKLYIYAVCIKGSSLLDSSHSPTCLTANLAPASESRRQRALITLVLRGLTRSMQSHCSIQYNHSHLLMRERKKQTDRQRGGRQEDWLRRVCFILFVFWAKWRISYQKLNFFQSIRHPDFGIYCSLHVSITSFPFIPLLSCEVSVFHPFCLRLAHCLSQPLFFFFGGGALSLSLVHIAV